MLARGAQGPLGRELTSLVSQLGAALGAPSNKKAKPKRAAAKKKKRGGSSKNPPTSQGMNTRPARSNRLYSAPATTGLVSFSAASRNHTVTVPFSTIANSQVVTQTAGSGAQFSISTSTGTNYFDLGPTTNPVGNLQNKPFGNGVYNVACAYARYRIKSLRLTYVPTVSTATSGSIILGATAENYVSTPPTPQFVADCQCSLTTPVWQSASLDITSVARLNDGEWLYVYQIGSTVSEERQDFACTLLVSSIGLANNAGGTNVTNGYLRFDGEIEFTSLSDVVLGFQSRPPQASSSSSSVSREDFHQVDEPELAVNPAQYRNGLFSPSPARGGR